MKKILIIVMIVLTTVAAYATKIDTDKAQITLPSGWEKLTPPTDTFIFMAKSPAVDGISRNVTLGHEELPETYTVKEYLDAIEPMMAMLNAKIVERGDDYQVLELTYQSTVLKQLQYFYIKNKVAYILTFTTLKSSYDKDVPEFKKMQKTFKLK